MKIYAAMYNPMTFESAYGVLSLHKTRKNAWRAILKHRKELVKDAMEARKKFKKIEVVVLDDGERVVDRFMQDDYKNYAQFAAWDVFEFELED